MIKVRMRKSTSRLKQLDLRPRTAPVGVGQSFLLKRPSPYNQHCLKKSNQSSSYNDASTAYLEKYNTLLSSAINHVLETALNVNEIPITFLNFLKTPNGDVANDQLSLKPKDGKRRRGVDRIVLATGIASIVSDLIGMLLKDRPQRDVLGYLQTVMQDRVNSATKKAANYKITNDKPHPKIFCVLVIGISGSGKTTLISVLKGNKNPKPKASMGFRPEILSLNDHTKIKFFDIGGSSRIRGIWSNYYHDAHSVIFVIDSACSNQIYQETLSVAKQSLGHKYLQGKPLLVLSNKKDLAESRPAESISSDMNLNVIEGGLAKIVETSLHPKRANNNGEADPNVDESIEWLLKITLHNFSDLDERVIEDGKEVESIRKKKQEERVRRVLGSSLCKAFGLKGEEVADVFDSNEGEDFMAHEIGLAGRHVLPGAAIEICALVGYQRFAMIIIGSFVTKQNKNMPRKSWDEAIDFVKSAREELGM